MTTPKLNITEIKQVNKDTPVYSIHDNEYPINLRDEYGADYKIELDESAYCESGGRKNPWYFQIPCKYGHIYPHGDRLMAWYCDGTNIRAKFHRDYPDIEYRQWGDYEVVFLFERELFGVIAEYARPKKVRRLSSVHKKQLLESARTYYFTKNTVLNADSDSLSNVNVEVV